MKRYLGVFLKNPEPGCVKTRLAESLGEVGAAEVYRRLVWEVFRQIRDANPDGIFVFFSPAEKETEIRVWIEPWVRDFPAPTGFFAQSGADLGERLQNATRTIFANIPEDSGVLLVGSDCIELDRELLATAWGALEEEKAQVVIGPATDGGYYLIGTRGVIPGLFENVPWSTEHALFVTLENVAALGLESFLLPRKMDVDTINDYKLFHDRLGKLPCLFFDRDGVVNEAPGDGYVLRKEDFHLNQGIVESLHTVRDRGYLAVIVTSQKGVGKKMMRMEELNHIHHNLQTELLQQGVSFDAIYSYTGAPGCEHLPKPDPAMIYAAAEDLPIDLNRSWIIGDADRDIAMGLNANLRGTIRIRGDKPILIEADHTLNSPSELPKLLRKVL